MKVAVRNQEFLKEAVGGELNSHYMDGDIYTVVVSELSVYKQRGNVQRGSPLYAAVWSTSLVEYLARGLRGRLHLHNSIKASFSPSLSSSVSIWLAHTVTPV